MGSTHNWPHRIDTACTIYIKGTGMVKAGGMNCPLAAGRKRMSARLGIVPFMPVLRSSTEVAYLIFGEFPSDVLRQGMGLGDVGKDMITATMTTSGFTTWNDTLFATQPIEFAGNCFIHQRVDAVNEFFLRGNGDTDSEFLRKRSRIVILN